MTKKNIIVVTVATVAGGAMIKFLHEMKERKEEKAACDESEAERDAALETMVQYLSGTAKLPEINEKTSRLIQEVSRMNLDKFILIRDTQSDEKMLEFLDQLKELVESMWHVDNDELPEGLDFLRNAARKAAKEAVY